MDTYVAKVTQKGQITLPAKLRKEEGWNAGSELIFKKDPQSNNVELSKKVNLYDTNFGNYDFQADLKTDKELAEPSSLQGNEGWGFESE
ncbi:AbrB/MazE/SpoVT family DNA-binding domain-containing protein [Lactobacillus sp. ESL0791]|uniref:AbrB/MazE/SpoVT family DNA-binding domain-containing protein n=1 Tax=Lactobacillus sp. ESL0791 TaxID=2983234 RepID=UPI0023F8C072|nr:AbrB/MazE/SpoVT family DNA-binding domain-containing protein [Lactobacillus sp. ESL0791]MDF7638621.1 AbrB/MazE/SpoVT family DNA-binding domain-containing protein [Lactobacillus sp. ESL0791]